MNLSAQELQTLEHALTLTVNTFARATDPGGREFWIRAFLLRKKIGAEADRRVGAELFSKQLGLVPRHRTMDLDNG